MTRPGRGAVLGLALALCGAAGCASERPRHDASGRGDSAALRWNEAVVRAIGRSDLPPTAVARALGIVHTCAYDAWAAYADTAVGAGPAWPGRRPAAERTGANRREAVSFAAYRAAVDLFPALRQEIFDPLLDDLGYGPGDATADAAGPAGVGDAACASILTQCHGIPLAGSGTQCHHDGSNQLGDEPGGRPGVPYSDTTGYEPRNRPMDVRQPFDPVAVTDPDRWQPLTYAAGGATVTQFFLTPQWARLAPFALESPSALRPSGPVPASDTDGFRQQAQEILDISANLTDEQKVTARYWAAPNTQWSWFAGDVARRDGHGAGDEGLERDVKMFFVPANSLANSLADAAIAAWDAKVHFDSVRPVTAVRALFAGRQVRAWGGPGRGTVDMDGSAWLPYQFADAPTPPFGEYTAAHSVLGAAAAESLRLFTGSDRLDRTETVDPGTSGFEPGVPKERATLHWDTFADAVAAEGMSRLYCGVHFMRGNLDGQEQGRRVAQAVWAKAQALFAGA